MILCRIAQIQAKLYLEQKKPDKAADIGVYLIQLAHKMEHSPQGRTLVNNVIGINIKKKAFEIIKEALNQGLSKQQARAISDKILPCIKSTDGYIEVLRIEYSLNAPLFNKGIKTSEQDEMVDSFSQVGKEIHKLYPFYPFIYKPNKTHRIMANHYRQKILSVIENKPFDNRPIKPNILSGNYLGELLLSLSLPRFHTSEAYEIDTKLKSLVEELENN